MPLSASYPARHNNSDATAVFPFDFARMPFTALLAWLVFAEPTDLWTWVGAAIIFGASAWQMRAEARGRKHGV